MPFGSTTPALVGRIRKIFYTNTAGVGTWNHPYPGTPVEMEITLCGAGASGSGSLAIGGGGGAFVQFKAYPTQNITFTVGAGGASVASNVAVGNAGGNTSINYTSLKGCPIAGGASANTGSASRGGAIYINEDNGNTGIAITSANYSTYIGHPFLFSYGLDSTNTNWLTVLLGTGFCPSDTTTASGAPGLGGDGGGSYGNPYEGLQPGHGDGAGGGAGKGNSASGAGANGSIRLVYWQ